MKRKNWLIILGILVVVSLSFARRSAPVPMYGKYFHDLGIKCIGQCDHDKTMNFFKQAVYHDPHLVDAYYQMGHLYGRLGDKENQIQLYKKTIEVDPAHFNAYYFVAEHYYEQGELEYLIDYVLESYETDEDRSKIYMILAKKFDASEQYDDAAFWYLNSVMFDTQDAPKAGYRLRSILHNKKHLTHQVANQVNKFKDHKFSKYNDEWKQTMDLINSDVLK